MSNEVNTKDKSLKKISIIVMSIVLIYIVCLLLISNNDTSNDVHNEIVQTNPVVETNEYIGIEDIPEYFGQIVITINNNVPYFEDEDITIENFEDYAPLDEFKRAGRAFANICSYTIPEERNYKRGYLI